MRWGGTLAGGAAATAPDAAAPPPVAPAAPPVAGAAGCAGTGPGGLLAGAALPDPAPGAPQAASTIAARSAARTNRHRLSRYSRCMLVLRPCCRQVAATVSTHSANRFPAALSEPNLLLRLSTAGRRAHSAQWLALDPT